MQAIATELKDITDVEALGLELGIRMSALERIMIDYPLLERQKKKVIFYWLKRRDIVRHKQNEHPTWNGLANAVAAFDPFLSKKIHHKHS